MEKKLLGIESKHWMIGAWILALGLTFCDIVNTTNILGIILRMVGLISLGFGTYFYGKLKGMDSLLSRHGRNVLCDEFRKFKGLKNTDSVTVEQLGEFIITLYESDKPNEKYAALFDVINDSTPIVNFIDFGDMTQLNEILKKMKF